MLPSVLECCAGGKVTARPVRSGDVLPAEAVRGTQLEAAFQKTVCKLLDVYMAVKRNQTKIERYGTAGPTVFSENAYSRCKRGRREDLGNLFFRSSWEANYARYLNFLKAQGQIADWEYEPETFVFHGETRGVISYLPDFRVTELDGSRIYHEVKGWETSKDRTKWARMKKHYPDIVIRVVDQTIYKALSRQCAGLIPYWEVPE